MNTRALLKNKGNSTAFLNIIYVFACIPEIRNIFIKGKLSEDRRICEFTDAFGKVIIEMEKGEPFFPRTLLLLAASSIGVGGSTVEIMIDKILSILHFSLGKKISIDNNEALSINKIKSNDNISNFTGNIKSIISDLFLMQYVTTFICNSCMSYSSLSFSIQRSIVIDVIPLYEDKSASLKDLIKKSFSIDFKNKDCANCDKNGRPEHLVHKSIFIMPEIIIINLKNKGGVLKEYDFLDLGEYFISNSNETTNYSILSALCFDSKTYYTLDFSDNNKIVKYSCDSINIVNDISTKDFVLLLYKRRLS
jgi:hypothetical protein